MTDEYIKREDAIKAFDLNDYMFYPFEAQNIIRAIPSADVAPVQKWIPVSERLPEHGVHVLVCCVINTVSGWETSYVCDAFHTEKKSEICSVYSEIDSEYDEENDEYYMPEGWWEVIKNWDEYS